MIIILGSGRSGTSFLAKLFDSHPLVLYRHEPDAIVRDPELPSMPPADVPDELVDRAGRYLQELVAVRHPDTTVFPLFPKSYRGPVRRRAHEGLTVAAKVLAKVGGPRLADHLRIPDLTGRGRRAKPVPVLKSVSGLGRAQAFLRSGPQVRIVHILRHPCAVVASRLRGRKMGLMPKTVPIKALFSAAETASYGYRPEEIEGASAEEQIAFQWLVHNDKAIRELDGHPRYASVVYEDLCGDPAGHMRRLFHFSGLDWCDQTERFISALTELDGNRSAGYFSILRPPQSALGRWKEQLSEEQIARVCGVVTKGAAARFFPDLAGEAGPEPRGSLGSLHRDGVGSALDRS